MTPSDPSLSLLQGTLDVLILKSLAYRPRHGYGIAQWIHSTTDQALEIEEGALYTALHRMQERGCLSSKWALTENRRRARIYRMTRKGRQRLAQQERAWERYAEAMFKVLRSPDPEPAG